MRCKKHFTDCSSGVGVCASCLRERLIILIENQSKDQAQVILVKPQIEDERRKSDAVPPQIVFPRSVSPYISRRKSDNAAAAWPHLQHSLSEQRFYSTPQIGPNGIFITRESNSYKRRHGKFSILSNLFRSKTQKFDNFDTKPRKSYSTASTTVITETVTASPSWFSNLFASKNKKKSRTMSYPVYGDQINRRGMSPTVEYDEECGDGSSGYSSGSPQGLKETPRRATPQTRRRQNQTRNVGGLVFCLSPLVRPSPNWSWNQKGMQPEATIPSGEMRVQAKPHLGVAASSRANRSRKLANFGRFHPNY